MVQPSLPRTCYGVNYNNGLWTSNRDCGLSTQLSNGRRFWVFCDSSLFDERKIKRFNGG